MGYQKQDTAPPRKQCRPLLCLQPAPPPWPPESPGGLSVGSRGSETEATRPFGFLTFAKSTGKTEIHNEDVRMFLQHPDIPLPRIFQPHINVILQSRFHNFKKKYNKEKIKRKQPQNCSVSSNSAGRGSQASRFKYE